MKGGWWQLDLRRRGMQKQLRGEVVIDDDIATTDEIRSSAFYNEFLPSVGSKWWAGVGFRDEAVLYCLSLQRSEKEGRFTSAEKSMLQDFSVRLNEIAVVSQTVNRVALAKGTNAFDRASCAAIAIEQHGRVVCANASADRLFDDFFRVSNGRLILGERRAAAAYAQSIERLRAILEGDPLAAPPIMIRRGDVAPPDYANSPDRWRGARTLWRCPGAVVAKGRRKAAPTVLSVGSGRSAVDPR